MSRRKKTDVGISLVPILSIQKCAMGIMVVIICAQNMVSLGQSLAQKDDQILEIAGNAHDKEAVYVECRDKGVLIHVPPQGKEASLQELRGPGPSAYHQLLDDLQKTRGKKYLVLLVRPEGLDAYKECYKMALDRQTGDKDFHVGKDALLSGGDIVITQEGKPILSKKKAVR